MKREELSNQFQSLRRQTEILCQPLITEDYVIQSIEDVSPPKWHLAHTNWFFETFILTRFSSHYKPFDPSFRFLFNSYYQGIGNPYPRAKRGLLSRPGVETIYTYRHYIDKHMLALIDQVSKETLDELSPLLTLGLHHEQQHQELLLMDIKHNFSIDPNFPCYKPLSFSTRNIYPPSKLRFIPMEGGLVEIGYRGHDFCFDNELPVHRTFLSPYHIANQLVTNGEYLEFIEAGGYFEPRYWLSDGWDCILKQNWQSPLYWYRHNNEWSIFSLNGLNPLNETEPLSHISYYEADAFARWRGARLPSEEEWEHFVIANNLRPESKNFMDSGHFHPQAAQSEDKALAQQFFGYLWEWTTSAYSAYPGYKALGGELGEYNGKFMTNQMVLRGGSCLTPSSHIRESYRNFFQPEKRWQFSGIRLAMDGE